MVVNVMKQTLALAAIADLVSKERHVKVNFKVTFDQTMNHASLDLPGLSNHESE